MPLTVDQLRSFDSNWGNLVVQQDANGAQQVKAGGLRHALASLFHTDAAQARNKATYTAIRNAIMQDDRFFAPDVKAKADELLKGLDNGSGISASTIKGIIRQLDEMSTPEKQREAVRKAAVGHLAALGVPGNVPASVQAKYNELAADFVAFRSDPKTSMASIKVDQRVAEFNRFMHGLFRSVGDDAEAKEVFCATLNNCAIGDGGTVSLSPADRLRELADTVKDNLRELDEIGNSRGDAVRQSFSAMLKRTGGLPPDIMTALADKGASLPKCGLELLDGHSDAGAIHSAISRMADAMDKASAELDPSVTRKLDLDEAGACLVKSAMVRLPEAAKRNLLAALESNDGMNLLGYYAQKSDNPKAQNMKLAYSSLVAHLRAEFNGTDPGADVQAPAVDAGRLPPEARCAFSIDDIFAGDLSQSMKDFALKVGDIGTVADPVATLGNRMDSIAKTKVFMQVMTGMMNLVEKRPDESRVLNFGKDDTAFARDLVRNGYKPGYMRISLPDGNFISPQTLEEGRDALVKFVTGNQTAKFSDLSDANEQHVKIKTKIQILMCLLHQASGDTATRSAGLAFNPGQEMPRLFCSQGGGSMEQGFVVARDEKGAITIDYKLHYSSPLVQITDEKSNLGHNSTDANSTADYSMHITIPADNLDTLAGAGWANFKSADALVAKENGADPTRFETLQGEAPDEFHFTGDVKLSFSLHANAV